MAIKILNDLLPIAEQTEVGVVKPDNVSITITETGELQSSVVDLPEEVVTAENYDNPKLWKGTLEEYNAIETKNPLVTYIITDDNVETLKTTDYNALSNKPSINDVTLEGNKTLEELNIQAADTSLTTSQITNCITKIPQDIKLELVDGTLTLKTGSKVYIPNGVSVFNTVTIQSDFVHSYGTVHTKGLLFLNLTGNTINGIEVFPHSFLFSGTSQPSGNLYIWYNTNNNIIKKYINGVAQNATISFPIAEFTGNGSQITSIKVFNGFGYIGNSWFRLQGVKPLYPNGFNTDGSYNNISTESTKVDVYTVTNNRSGDLVIESNGIVSGVVKEINSKSEASGDGNYYILSENKHYYYKDSIWTHLIRANIGKVTYDSTGRITSFNPNTTFQAVDRNDTEWASTASKPSNRYIDLTLGASGSTYAAPANGWFSLWQKDNTTSAGKITIRNKETLFGVGTENSTTGFTNLILPTHKNEQMAIYYTNITATDFQFRFIYDEGVR